MKTMEKGAATAKVEMTVTPAETVRSVKEKVAAAQLIAFPEHKLVCGGEKLDEKKTLGDCGVTEASAVEFVLEATEDSVVALLKAKKRAKKEEREARLREVDDAYADLGSDDEDDAWQTGFSGVCSHPVVRDD